jgi:regulator of sigma E protease
MPERLRRRAAAGEPARLTILRPDGQDHVERLEITLPLQVPTSFARADIPGTPVAIPSLGIALPVLHRVHGVEPHSPAASVGIRPGDEILQAKFVADPRDPSDENRRYAELEPIRFRAEHENWPAFTEVLQAAPPGMKVELTIQRGGARRKVELYPENSQEWFNPDRGLINAPQQDILRARSLREAVVLGARETVDSLLMVYRFLQRLIHRHISPRLLGGPITIAKVAGDHAYAGPAMLLIFLTMLSANLAVINFLPIPVLDGGHMVFLILEGILRRPVSEKLVIALHTIGFVFIVGVMLFVLALDFELIPREM